MEIVIDTFRRLADKLLNYIFQGLIIPMLLVSCAKEEAKIKDTETKLSVVIQGVAIKDTRNLDLASFARVNNPVSNISAGKPQTFRSEKVDEFTMEIFFESISYSG